jgi:hypothetical protein
MQQEITDKESRLFRTQRIAWVICFALLALAIGLRLDVLTFVFAAIFLSLSIYVIFWPCPRCGKWFVTKFGAVSWPFLNNCMHCGAQFPRTR